MAEKKALPARKTSSLFSEAAACRNYLNFTRLAYNMAAWCDSGYHSYLMDRMGRTTTRAATACHLCTEESWLPKENS